MSGARLYKNTRNFVEKSIIHPTLALSGLSAILLSKVSTLILSSGEMINYISAIGSLIEMSSSCPQLSKDMKNLSGI